MEVEDSLPGSTFSDSDVDGSSADSVVERLDHCLIFGARRCGVILRTSNKGRKSVEVGHEVQ